MQFLISRFFKLKIFVLVFLVSSGLLLSLGAKASTTARVAVLDLQEALLGTERIRLAFIKIDEQLRNEEAPIRQLAEEGRSLQERLQRDAAIMSDAERTRLTQQMQQKLQEYQQRSLRLQQNQQQLRQEVISANRPRLEAVVNQLIEERKLDLLLDRQAAHFAKPAFDLTPVVAERLNAQD